MSGTVQIDEIVENDNSFTYICNLIFNCDRSVNLEGQLEP